jgi:hypothetical protein
MQIYSEDMDSVSNCHNVGKHAEFDALNTVVPNTATASATFTGAERARCVFWFEGTKCATKN